MSQVSTNAVKHGTSLLRAILTKNGIPVVTSAITSKGHDFPTDGAVDHNGHLIAIIEVKGEIGSKGTEPYA
jgi:hypothetical protein